MPGAEQAGSAFGVAIEKRLRRKAMAAHWGGILIPWWWPMLARQSQPSPGFVDDHRRVAQRVQGAYLLATWLAGVVAIVVQFQPVVSLVALALLFFALCVVEVRFARRAAHGQSVLLVGWLRVRVLSGAQDETTH